jgi:predicted ATPase
MISEWQLKNFKSFYDQEKPLELAPLTVLTGTNSSGKSTIIQSMLLIAQTMRNPIGEIPLMLNGPLVQLGKFEDIKSYNSGVDKIFIGFTCLNMDAQTANVHKGPSTGSIIGSIAGGMVGFLLGPAGLVAGLTIGASAGTAFDILKHPSGIAERKCSITFKDLGKKIFICDVEYSNGFVSKAKNVKKCIIKAKMPENKQNNLILDIVYIDDFVKNKIISDEEKEILDGVSLFHFFPKAINISVDKNWETAKKTTEEIVENFPQGIINAGLQPEIMDYLRNILDGPILFDKLLSDVKYCDGLEGILGHDQYLEVQNILKNHKEELVRKIYDTFKSSPNEDPVTKRKKSPDVFSKAVQYYIDYFSSSFKYLGPLRYLNSVYPFSTLNDPRDVGIQGEFTFSVLAMYSAEIIKYILPQKLPELFLDPQQASSLITEAPLQEALKEWLNYLEVADSFSYEQKGKQGFEGQVKLFPGDKAHDLTEVGIGVSQVLPILVMCLLANKDSTLVFEQPELHLHPKVQSRLADFFLSMALLDKQCIVETHSEYLIYALRYRISESLLHEDERIQKAIKILFTEKKDGKSEFREINVNKHGELSAWPDGFFDERQKLSDRMLDNILSEAEDTDD